MWSVVRSEETGVATATVVRSKDGNDEGATWSFTVQPHEIGVDREGAPIISCHVEISTEPARKGAAVRKAPKLSPAQQRVFDILAVAVGEAGAPDLAGDLAPRSTRAITRETAKKHAKSAGWWDPEDNSARNRFNARLNELVAKRVIGLTAKHLWLVGDVR